MSEKINFAVIGCGMLARSQHIPNIAASDKSVLHTCCDLADSALDECKNACQPMRYEVDGYYNPAAIVQTRTNPG